MNLEDILFNENTPDVVSSDEIQVIEYEDEEVIQPDVVQNLIDNPPFATKMLKVIDEVNEYTWNRGELGGLDWGYESLNQAFEGLNTGIILVGGQSNVGKSSFMLQLTTRIANANRELSARITKKAYCVYFSLDDTNNELIPRLVAIDQQIKINAVSFPKKYEHNKEVMDKRDLGFERLKNNVKYIGMQDANEGSSIEYIVETCRDLKLQLDAMEPNVYTLVIVIDNFHDVDVDAKGYTEDNAKYDYISDKLGKLANELDSPIICSAEFKKIPGGRRPQRDDIRSSGKIAYEAKAILLCHNDYSIKQEQAGVFWELEDHSERDGITTTKMPVWEAQIDKNKFSSKKGRLYWEFIPDMATFKESSPEDSLKYTQMLQG